MNTNPIILAALAGINLPKYPLTLPEGLLNNPPSEYITFNDADNRPEMYASGQEITETAQIQVHIFSKTDPKTRAKQIRNALRTADFVIVDTQEFYEEDTKFFHAVIEAQFDADFEEMEGD